MVRANEDLCKQTLCCHIHSNYYGMSLKFTFIVIQTGLLQINTFATSSR